jgi:hypothetical protein
MVICIICLEIERGIPFIRTRPSRIGCRAPLTELGQQSASSLGMRRSGYRYMGSSMVPSCTIVVGQSIAAVNRDSIGHVDTA